MAISCYKCQFPIQMVGRRQPVARMGIVGSPQYNRLGGSGWDWHSLLQRSDRKANSQESAANCPDRQIPSVWLSWRVLGVTIRTKGDSTGVCFLFLGGSLFGLTGPGTVPRVDPTPVPLGVMPTAAAALVGIPLADTVTPPLVARHPSRR